MLPVDFFFRSMARDCGPRCMGVVLSGTGVDGMRGLQDIREAGGLTFAQDPATARFQGMPTAAAAGADAVLAPEAIADELVRISRHPYVARGALPPQAEEGLKKLFLLIRSAFGTDLSFYKFGTVQRRIERRMALNKIERVEDYVRFVQGASGGAEDAVPGSPDQRHQLLPGRRAIRDPRRRGVPADHRAEEAG